MQQFESLTKIGQIRRLKQLAETALSAYDLGETRLTSLMHFFNTTFRVDTCSTGATMPHRRIALELGRLRDLQPYMGGNRDTR